MAITFPLSLPDTVSIVNTQFEPSAVVAVSESPFSLQQQVQVHPSDRWVISAELIIMQRANVEAWISFFLKLNGREGTFLIGPTAAGTPRGTPTGTPLVNGAGQTGKVLNTQGWTNNSTGNLLEGDYIQIGTGSTSRLYKTLTASVDADGAGLSAIDIWPRLRESPANGAAIVTADAVGLFRLANNVMPWNLQGVSIYEASFDAVEAT